MRAGRDEPGDDQDDEHDAELTIGRPLKQIEDLPHEEALNHRVAARRSQVMQREYAAWQQQPDHDRDTRFNHFHFAPRIQSRQHTSGIGAA